MNRSLFRKIDCHSLPVPDLESAIAFYESLGHELVWRDKSGAGFRIPGCEAELVLHTDGRPAETDFTVESVPEAIAAFVEAGGRVVHGPFEIRIGLCAVLADPWDNPIVVLDNSKGLLEVDEQKRVIPVCPAPGGSLRIARRHPMQMKQVFSTYRGKEDGSLGQSKYCPFCGTQLALKEKGDRTRPACPSCGFVQYRNPVPGVVVLIDHEGCVLLGKRRGGFGAGKWGLPQGYIEFDEDFITAAIREVKEEAGLDVEIRSIINVVSNLLSPRLHTLAIVLLAGVVSGELCAGDDLESLEWVPLAEPLPEMAFEADEHIIERYWQTKLEWGLPVDPDFACGGNQ